MSDIVHEVARRPGADIVECPCCGEPVVDIESIDGSLLDSEDWSDRVELIETLLRKSAPEMTDREVRRRSALIVTYHMQIDLRREGVDETLIGPFREPEKEQPGKLIYFIQGVSRGPIKIGITTNVEVRLKAIQYHEDLNILATISGDQAMEAELHRRFQHLRGRGEWFRPEQELLEYISEIA